MGLQTIGKEKIMNGSYGWVVLGMHEINGLVNALWLQTQTFPTCSPKIVSDKKLIFTKKQSLGRKTSLIGFMATS